MSNTCPAPDKSTTSEAALLTAINNLDNSPAGQFLRKVGGVLVNEATSDSGANTALSNLASVAINTSLISDTTNTDSLGSSTVLWKDLFVTNIGATGTRVTKGWFTDLEVTNAIAGSITGNAATATAAASQVITDNAIATVDDEDAADNDYAKFTANGLEGRSYSEVKQDLDLEVGTDIAAQTHASQHAVSGSDSVFPADPGADRYLMWDDDPGQLVWATVSGTGASTALDNLASVAINTSLISDTTNTDDLGSSTKLWKDLFVTNIGATATRVTKGWFTDIESTNMPTVGGTAILTSLTAPQFTTIELGHASDTTISRSAAGVLAVEGTAIPKGTGTENEIAYWSGTNTLGTLATATYPSLTELAYVKGVTSAIQTQIGNKANSASPTFTGTITLADNCRIDLTLPTADGYATGPTTDSFNAGYSSAVGDLVYFGTGGKWLEADADAIATCGSLLGIALEAKTDGQAMKVALPGSMVRIDAWNWNVGKALYAGETLGALSESIPTGADGVVRVVGFSLSADVIFFNPSSDHSTTVA